MRVIICLTTALALCSAAAVAKPATFDIKKTTWTFVDKKDGKLKESIDANGNYITNTIGGKHIDHGTAVMKDSKACFTSAMTKDGEICWTTPPHAMALGHTFVTTSDKGEKLKVTRVAYVKLSMPK
jgi:hypothetical protein